jgi:hypothetical protein
MGEGKEGAGKMGRTFLKNVARVQACFWFRIRASTITVFPMPISSWGGGGRGGEESKKEREREMIGQH